MHCSNPHREFRDRRAEPCEEDSRFGIYGVENPHPPIFVNLGAQGRAGEGGGIWERFRVREGRRGGSAAAGATRHPATPGSF